MHGTVQTGFLYRLCERLYGQARCGALTKAEAYDNDVGLLCETENVIERSWTWDDANKRYDIVCKWTGTAQQTGEVNTVNIYTKDSEGNYHTVSVFTGLSQAINAGEQLYIEFHLYIYKPDEDINHAYELTLELTDPTKEKLPNIDKVEVRYQGSVTKTITGKSNANTQSYSDTETEGYEAIIEFVDDSTEEYSWDELRFYDVVDNVVYFQGNVTADSKSASDIAKFRLRARNVRPK